MKAYKVEILIIDHDELGEKEIKQVIENTRYPNRCISPDVMKIETREIGEWHDYHILNFTNQRKSEYDKLFSSHNE